MTSVVCDKHYREEEQPTRYMVCCHVRDGATVYRRMKPTRYFPIGVIACQKCTEDPSPNRMDNFHPWCARCAEDKFGAEDSYGMVQ